MPALTKKILLVDDESDFVLMMKMRLEANRYQVVTANDGMTGLKKAKEEQPHLILLDVMMPGMDGIEVLRRLRAANSTKQTPIVMLTAKRESQLIFKAQELRATDYLMKPCDSKELLSMVRKYVPD
jgi:DNA-binding response OmpR family regulator